MDELPTHRKNPPRGTRATPTTVAVPSTDVDELPTARRNPPRGTRPAELTDAPPQNPSVNPTDVFAPSTDVADLPMSSGNPSRGGGQPNCPTPILTIPNLHPLPPLDKQRQQHPPTHQSDDGAVWKSPNLPLQLHKHPALCPTTKQNDLAAVLESPTLKTPPRHDKHRLSTNQMRRSQSDNVGARKSPSRPLRLAKYLPRYPTTAK